MTEPATTATATSSLPSPTSGAPLRLRFAGVSDVGRVRKDNQDSAYAGPWLLAVCDGVGGAARGDIASSTTIQQLRRLDEPPTPDLLGQVAGALHRAHDRIGELVEEDPGLTGTSTTATVALFDGTRLAVGHLGDSRAYRYRDGALVRLTRDHTFVQGLVDEGRITEEEARVHPHRNLILKALDGIHHAEPDLFLVDLAVGDRLLLCSDGVCGVLDDRRLATLLAGGTAEFAAVELVRRSLAAGSTDNVTCVVADVVDAAAPSTTGPTTTSSATAPLVLGAAAELPRRGSRHPRASLFRGHRSGDTGELEPIRAAVPTSGQPGAAPLATELPEDLPFAISTDPIDPEAYRYAPRAPHQHRWLRRGLSLVVLLGVVWMVLAGAWSWTQREYYVGEQDGTVVIFRGVNADLLGLSLSSPYETTNVQLDRLAEFDADTVRAGIDTGGLDEARRTVENLAARMQPTTTVDG